MELLFLALNWSQALDNVHPDRLCHARQRCGISQGFSELVHAVYADGRFIVQDASHHEAREFNIQECSIILSVPVSDTSAELRGLLNFVEPLSWMNSYTQMTP